MIVDALEWMTQHPFWSLYAAIHGFRPATRIYKDLRDEIENEENNN